MKVIELGEGVWGDARGWGLDPYRTSGIVPGAEVSCHVVSMNPGAVRGNHLHPRCPGVDDCFRSALHPGRPVAG